MSATYLATVRMNKGEVSPLMYSGIDLDFFRSSLARCENWSVLVQGGVQKRSGFRFVAEVDDSSLESRLLPFEFNADQSYVIEYSKNNNTRFLALAGIVESGGSPYSISHPFSADEVDLIHHVQFSDKAYMTTGERAVQVLTRSGETSWAIADYDNINGPYLSKADTETTLSPADTGHATPKMTSNNAPSGIVSNTAGNANAYLPFDRLSNTNSNASNAAAPGATGFIQYNFQSGNAKVVDAYWLVAAGNENEEGDMFEQWEIQGSDNGSSWVTLDRQEGETGWSSGETRFFEFENKTAFQYYRIDFVGGGGNDATNSFVNEFAMHERAEDQTPFNLTASSTDGINGGNGFASTDVGRHIRLQGSDGVWRWAKITEYVGALTVKIQLYGHALPTTSRIVNWRLGAWSEESGWPRTVALFKERLGFDKGPSEPTSMSLTRQGVFNDFSISSPVLSTDAVSISLLSGSMNKIHWLVEDEVLVNGSKKQIRAVGPSDTTLGFSATNVTQVDGPISGSSDIQPVTLSRTAFYCSRGKTDLHVIGLDESGKIVAPIISRVAEHFFRGQFKEMATTDQPRPVVYIVTLDGKLIEFVYDKEERVVAFSELTTQGTFESVAVIPGRDERSDDVYVVVKRTINGTEKRFIEVLEPAFMPGVDAQEDAFFVDSGLSYSGAATTSISGLDHLEGETVRVLADGGQIDDLVVSSGEITLPNEASKVIVGLPYQATLKTLPIAGPAQDGTLFGRPRAITEVKVDMYESGPLKAGQVSDTGTQRLDVLNPKQNNNIVSGDYDLRSGWAEVTVEGDWMSGEGQAIIQSDNALPSIVRAAQFQFEATP